MLITKLTGLKKKKKKKMTELRWEAEEEQQRS